MGKISSFFNLPNFIYQRDYFLWAETIFNLLENDIYSLMMFLKINWFHFFLWLMKDLFEKCLILFSRKKLLFINKLWFYLIVNKSLFKKHLILKNISFQKAPYFLKTPHFEKNLIFKRFQLFQRFFFNISLLKALIMKS